MYQGCHGGSDTKPKMPMFANEKSIDNLEALFKELKSYFGLQKDYVKLQLVEKLTALTSALVLIVVILILGMMALFYFSFVLVYAIEPYLGSLMLSYAAVGAVLAVIAWIAYLLRKPLIIHPMVNFMARLFLEDNGNNSSGQ